MKSIFITLIVGASAFAAINKDQSVTDMDRAYVHCAYQTSLLELELAQYAQNNAASPEVRDYSAKLVAAHTDANQSLVMLAEQKGIVLPLALESKMQQKYNLITMEKGKYFDSAYLATTKKDHQRMVCASKKEAKHGSDPAVTAWASASVPTLEHHIEEATLAAQ
jgi:putative membrane protein